MRQLLSMFASNVEVRLYHYKHANEQHPRWHIAYKEAKVILCISVRRFRLHYDTTQEGRRLSAKWIHKQT